MKAARLIEASPEPKEPDQDDAQQLLVRIIESEGPFSRDVSDRVRRACRAFVDAAGARGLEDCIGLRVYCGQRSFVMQFAEQKRLHAFSDA